MKTDYDIAVLAREAGVSSRTIRYYGELGLIPAQGRGPGGRRRYGLDALERLRFIARLKKLGLTLEEIGELNQAFETGHTASLLRHLETLLEQHLGEVARRMDELKDLRTEMNDYLGRIRSKQNEKRKRKSA